MKNFWKYLLKLTITATILIGLGLGLFQTVVGATHVWQLTTKSRVSADSPNLKVMKVVDLQVQVESDRKPFIRVALFMSEKSQEKLVVQDILTTYQWANDKFKPIKCGEDYPIEMRNCVPGQVEIWILFDDAPVPVAGGGTAAAYQVGVLLGLDQLQINALVNAGVTSMDALITFHEKVEQSTQGTGGLVRVPNATVTFRGFRNMR